MATAHMDGYRPKIVVIGGGSGISNLLEGLKQYSVDLTAIVTMFDSGGSSGLLQREFGYPPFGDLRRCLMALSDDTEETHVLREALDFRFGRDSSLNGHTVGNLFLAALTTQSDDLEQAMEKASQMLHAVGRVIPVTLGRSELCAQLDDGVVIHGESDIDLRGISLPHIRRVFLDRDVRANPRAIQAIMEADGVVLGPGDLYTSILPNLLPKGIVEAMASCSATRVYVCNLMTKLGETDGFKASDFVREVTEYLATALDWVVVNTAVLSELAQYAYKAEGASPVIADIETIAQYVTGISAAPLTTRDLPLRHDQRHTAEAVLRSVHAGRLTQEVARPSRL